MDSLQISRALPALRCLCGRHALSSRQPLWTLCMCGSRVQLFVTQWTVACQALLYMGFSSKSIELPVLPPRDLSDPGIKPMSSTSPAQASRFFTTEAPGRPLCALKSVQSCTELWRQLMKGGACAAVQHSRGSQGQSHFRGKIVWIWPGPLSWANLEI